MRVDRLALATALALMEIGSCAHAADAVESRTRLGRLLLTPAERARLDGQRTALPSTAGGSARSRKLWQAALELALAPSSGTRAVVRDRHS